MLLQYQIYFPRRLRRYQCLIMFRLIQVSFYNLILFKLIIIILVIIPNKYVFIGITNQSQIKKIINVHISKLKLLSNKTIVFFIENLKYKIFSFPTPTKYKEFMEKLIQEKPSWDHSYSKWDSEAEFNRELNIREIEMDKMSDKETQDYIKNLINNS